MRLLCNKWEKHRNGKRRTHLNVDWDKNIAIALHWDALASNCKRPSPGTALTTKFRNLSAYHFIIGQWDLVKYHGTSQFSRCVKQFPEIYREIYQSFFAISYVAMPCDYCILAEMCLTLCFLSLSWMGASLDVKGEKGMLYISLHTTDHATTIHITIRYNDAMQCRNPTIEWFRPAH